MARRQRQMCIRDSQDVLNDLLDDFKKRNFKNIITKDEQIELDDQNKANKIFG